MKTLVLLVGFLCGLAISASSQRVPTPEEKKMLLERHNYWRADVGVEEKMTWSNEMTRLASNWAKQLKEKGCAFEHRPNNQYGENLFKGTIGYYSAKDVVDAWGSEKVDYNYDKNKCPPGKMCGHYTQIVWRTTSKVGCAIIQCGGYDLWVCNYDPPGNWVGEKPYE